MEITAKLTFALDDIVDNDDLEVLDASSPNQPNASCHDVDERRQSHCQPEQ
jgi:hypothetical protein